MGRLVVFALALGCAHGDVPGTPGEDSGVPGGDAHEAIDARPPPDARVDATPPPDAEPPDAEPPDAEPPCTVQDLNLLTNASFDLGTTGWNELSAGGFGLSGLSLKPPRNPDTLDHAGWLGGGNSRR